MSNIVSIAQAARIMIEAARNRKRNGKPFKILLLGPPGVAKTSAARQLAQTLEQPITEWLLSNKAPEHITGYPWIDQQTGVMNYAQPVFWPTEPGILLVDELGQCTIQVQNVAMPIVLEGTNGVHTLPEGTITIACANRAEDRAGSTVLTTALRRRFDVVLEIEPTKAEWLDWAKANNVNPFVIAYVESQCDTVVEFNPKEKGGQMLPATLEQAGDHMDLYNNDADNPDLAACLHGTLGRDRASGLIAFVQTFDALPSYDDIRTNPEQASVVPEHLAAVAAMLSEHAKYVHGAAVVRYIMRYNDEAQARLVTSLKEHVKQHPEVAALAEVLQIDI